jgi:isocitrate lyase
MTDTSSRQWKAYQLQQDWATNPRWQGIHRDYTADQVIDLQGSDPVEHSLARRGANKLWRSLLTEPYVATLGALTGMQALQQVKAGVKGVYLSGWQVAGDANTAGEMYPDQSLYPVNSVPEVVRRINATFARADQIQWMERSGDVDFF